MATKEQVVTIVSKIKRIGGTKIDLLGKKYHFAPPADQKDDPDAKHVCDIPFSDAGAIHRLLTIKDGYELLDPNAEIPARPKADPGQTIGNEKPKDPANKPIIITDGEKEYNLSEMTPEELRLLAKETFGIQVHHKWNDQTVIAKIIEKTRGE